METLFPYKSVKTRQGVAFVRIGTQFVIRLFVAEIVSTSKLQLLKKLARLNSQSLFGNIRESVAFDLGRTFHTNSF